jgi:hypothetical protein
MPEAHDGEIILIVIAIDVDSRSQKTELSRLRIVVRVGWQGTTESAALGSGSGREQERGYYCTEKDGQRLIDVLHVISPYADWCFLFETAMSLPSERWDVGHPPIIEY